MNDSTVAPARAIPKASKPKPAVACSSGSLDPGTADLQPQAPVRSSADIDFLDRANVELRNAQSVLVMLCEAFAGREPGDPLCKVPGLLGTVQFLHKRMHVLKEITVEQPGPVGDLYWEIHFCASIIELVDHVESAGGYVFNFTPQIYYGYFDAALSCVERAQAALAAEDAA